jgi:radical SAM protein with 4Fe4S-binding SPASM domain
MLSLRNLRRFVSKALKQPGYAYRVFLKRLGAYAGYYLTDGYSGYPEAITLFLTHRCNLRCHMCGQWGESGVTAKQGKGFIQEELSFDEIKAVIDDVSAFSPNITLFGGEPLLHPACIEAIKYIKQKRMHCLIITNGSLIQDKAGELSESGLDELNLSLDGDAALHDQIRGMPGLFEKVMAGLEMIRGFKKKTGSGKPLVNLQCTINRYNYQRLEEMLGVAERAGADSLTFHNLIFLAPLVLQQQKAIDEALGCSSLDWEGFIAHPGIDPEVLYEKMRKISSGKYAFNVDFYPNFSKKALGEYYRNPQYRPSGASRACISPWMVAYIFPDGNVRPCLNFNYAFGNVKKQKFSQIWLSAEALRFRKQLKKNKIFPVCVRCTELYRY